MRPLTMLVEVPTGGVIRPRRFGKRHLIDERTKSIETRVFAVRRLLGGGSGTAQHVEVEAYIPERHRAGLSTCDPRWVAPGVLRTKAYLHSNYRTIERFFASGLSEWLDPERVANR
ncbi:hypothetical protein [Burkholderia plantarii]|uniref:Uncharacterized protein n=1 Tax=Burkholderia plantarii TaxID=41899 RepID=A0A0B6RVL3_BURPL|nr:hypothetical protein [Burkholderia plantarii]AJK46204.1 hypothetical protein BGL_1c16950 [Burkholderia plantarii]